MAHGTYPTWKGAMWDWALNGPPAGMTLRLAFCDETFAYNAAHESLADITGVVYDSFELQNVAFSATGKLTADVLIAAGLAANDIFSALVLYWHWPTGTQLFQYTTESPAAALPIELIDTTLQVRWSLTEGIYQL